MGGRSLLLAHQLQGKNVLLVGGGEVAFTRLKKLISTGAKVTLVSPEIQSDILDQFCPFLDATSKRDTINEEWDEEGRNKSIYRVIKDNFKDEYLSLYTHGSDSGWSLILTCIPNKQLSEHIYREAKKLFGSQQTINVADNPPLCDIYFGANLEFSNTNDNDDCYMQMMLSSNGMGPRYIAMVRDEIGKMLQGIDFEKSLQNLGTLRSKIRKIADDDVKDTKYRMNWLKQCTDIFGVKNCEVMDADKLIVLFEEMYIQDKNMDFPAKEKMLNEYSINK